MLFVVWTTYRRTKQVVYWMLFTNKSAVINIINIDRDNPISPIALQTDWRINTDRQTK